MSFIQRFHDILHVLDPRPLVSEVRDGAVHARRRPEFASRVARARGALASAGVRPGDRVVLLAANSEAWVVADLAILFEGCVCVPLYVRQTPEELLGCLHDCGPKLVIVEDAVVARTLEAAWPGSPVTTLVDLLDGAPRVAPPAPRDPDDCVTIVYTSGTSGEPKGAMISRANVDHMLPVTSSALDVLMGEVAGHETVFHYLPFCFMGSRIVLWTCIWREVELRATVDLDRIADDLVVAEPHYFLNVPVLLDRVRNGARAAIAEKAWPIRWLAARAERAYEHLAAGGFVGQDQFWFNLADKHIFSAVRARLGPNLRFLICGSAPLHPDTQKWFGMLGVPVYQVYGLTETTAIVTMDRAQEVVPGRVGFPIAGCEVRLGPDDELQVRGPHVFLGYYKRPDATEAAFDGAWFRTGDQGAVDAEGRWAIQGRVKNLIVPSSGHNVAPEPLEAALRARLEGAEQVVVLGHGRPHLVALVTGPVRPAQVQEAVDAVNAGLPHYKRVRAFHLHPTPLTPDDGLLTANGKLKRGAIEAAFASQIDALYR